MVLYGNCFHRALSGYYNSSLEMPRTSTGRFGSLSSLKILHRTWFILSALSTSTVCRYKASRRLGRESQRSYSNNSPSPSQYLHLFSVQSSKMPSRTLFIHAFILGSLTVANAFSTYRPLLVGPRSDFERRESLQVPVACYNLVEDSQPGICDCPTDNNGDSGVLINLFPGYQCAYSHGACTWDSMTGNLSNKQQTNCPQSAPCSGSGCSCPKDKFGDHGVLINTFKGYQCAYQGGACTWDSDGDLTNTKQTNCPKHSKCAQLS